MGNNKPMGLHFDVSNYKKFQKNEIKQTRVLENNYDLNNSKTLNKNNIAFKGSFAENACVQFSRASNNPAFSTYFIGGSSCAAKTFIYKGDKKMAKEDTNYLLATMWLGLGIGFLFNASIIKPIEKLSESLVKSIYKIPQKVILDDNVKSKTNEILEKLFTNSLNSKIDNKEVVKKVIDSIIRGDMGEISKLAKTHKEFAGIDLQKIDFVRIRETLVKPELLDKINKDLAKNGKNLNFFGKQITLFKPKNFFNEYASGLHLDSATIKTFIDKNTKTIAEMGKELSVKGNAKFTTWTAVKLVNIAFGVFLGLYWDRVLEFGSKKLRGKSFDPRPKKPLTEEEKIKVKKKDNFWKLIGIPLVSAVALNAVSGKLIGKPLRAIGDAIAGNKQIANWGKTCGAASDSFFTKMDISTNFLLAPTNLLTSGRFSLLSRSVCLESFGMGLTVLGEKIVSGIQKPIAKAMHVNLNNPEYRKGFNSILTQLVVSMAFMSVVREILSIPLIHKLDDLLDKNPKIKGWLDVHDKERRDKIYAKKFNQDQSASIKTKIDLFEVIKAVK